MTQRLKFTLIELMIVVSIIAVLITLLLPALKNAKVQAQVIACKSQLKQQYVCLNMYTNDFDGVLPDSNRNAASDIAWTISTGPLNANGSLNNLGKLVQLYLHNNNEIFSCPSRDLLKQGRWNNIVKTNYAGGSWGSWGDGTNYVFHYAAGWRYGATFTGGTYHFNPRVFSSYTGVTPRLLKPTIANYSRKSNLEPGRKILIADCNKLWSDQPFKASFHANGRYQNTLMVDGSIKFIKNYWDDLYPTLPSYANGYYWHVGTPYFNWWTTFQDGEHCQ